MRKSAFRLKKVRALQHPLLDFQIHETRSTLCPVDSGARGWSGTSSETRTMSGQGQEPVGDAVCEEGARGELHLPEALRRVRGQLSNPQLNPGMPWSSSAPKDF